MLCSIIIIWNNASNPSVPILPTHHTLGHLTIDTLVLPRGGHLKQIFAWRGWIILYAFSQHQDVLEMEQGEIEMLHKL